MGKTGGNGASGFLNLAPSRRTIALRAAVTLAISAVGGMFAQAIGIPGGFVMGGAVATTIAAMLGFPVWLPVWLRDTAFVLVGMSMGASVARDSLTLMAQWPFSLAGLVLELVIIISFGGWMLTRFFRLDSGTAYLASFPGHLSFIMGIASAGVGDPRQIAIMQVIRVLMLTICVPIGALFLPIAHFPAATGQIWMSWQTILALAAACALTGFVFTKIKVPAGYVLGAMAFATSAKLGGLYSGSMPPLLLNTTFIVTGALIGSRFAGITRTEFTKAALGGFIATIFTVAVVTAIAYGVSTLVDMPFGQIWLGLAPGALEGMGALGISLGYDAAFIATHHVTRLLLLSFVIPIVVITIKARDRRRAQQAAE